MCNVNKKFNLKPVIKVLNFPNMQSLRVVNFVPR